MTQKMRKKGQTRITLFHIIGQKLMAVEVRHYLTLFDIICTVHVRISINTDNTNLLRIQKEKRNNDTKLQYSPGKLS